VLEHPETVEIRAPKSKRNKLKSAENRYKRAEKVFPISLGSRDRAFESPHSDQNPLKSVDFRGFFLFASETAGSAGGGIPQKSFSFKHRAQRANREESSDSFKREVEEASPVYGLRGG